MPDAPIDLLQRARQARQEGRLDDARRNLVDAVARSRRKDAAGDLVEALAALGQIERDLGCGAAALALYKEAAALCRAAGDTWGLAHALRHAGDIHREAGRRRQAETSLGEALALVRGLEPTPPLVLANALRPLALLKETGGDAEGARPLWLEARDLYRACGVAAGVAECDAHLARTEPA